MIKKIKNKSEIQIYDIDTNTREYKYFDGHLHVILRFLTLFS